MSNDNIVTVHPDVVDWKRLLKEANDRIRELEIVNSAYVRDMDELMQQAKELEAERDRLRVALEQYADKNNWVGVEDTEWTWFNVGYPIATTIAEQALGGSYART